MNNLTDLIKKISISEGLDRCVDDFTNINEDMVLDQTGSYQLIKNRPEDEVEGDGKRVRKYTEKGLQYQKSVLMNRRSQLHKRLMKHLAVVKENLQQFDDAFKFLIEVHQQHC